MSFDPSKYAKKPTAGVVRYVAGEVYLVDDKCLTYPDQRARKPHETDRRVIVLQDESASAYGNLKTLLVAPCSATWGPGPFDLDFGEVLPNGFTKSPTVFVSLVQPILKTDLWRREGTLLPEELDPLMDLVAQLFGWASPRKI